MARLPIHSATADSVATITIGLIHTHIVTTENSMGTGETLISRRKFLEVGMSFGAMFLTPRISCAEHACVPEGYGSSCDAKIPTKQFTRVTAIQQRFFWCWAASLEMIFKWHRKDITQRDIVYQTFGSEIDAPADPFVLVNAVNRTFTDRSGGNFSVTSRIWSSDFLVAQIDNGTLIHRLTQEQPLVVCNSSHMMVLVGMNYFRRPDGGVFVREAWVADPMVPGSVTGHMGPKALAPGFRYLHSSEMMPVPVGQLRFVADLQVL